MSQPPPPPPSQPPPPGGSGAPQDPNSGSSYGYPQSPGPPPPPPGQPNSQAAQAAQPTQVSQPAAQPSQAAQAAQPTQVSQPAAQPSQAAQAAQPTQVSQPAAQPPQAGQPPQPPPPPPTPPPGGGYGYPQQPPGGPQSGYGYPQQPPGGPQSGYGYPQQPPGDPKSPYGPGGYPTVPGGPGGPGYPGYPGGPGGSGGGSNTPKIIAIVASALAVVMLVGVGVFFLTKDDDSNDESKDDKGSSQGAGGGGEKPADTRAKLVVDEKAPEVSDTYRTEGAWATDKAFYKVGEKKIHGTGLTGGSASDIPLTGVVCAASRQQTDDNKTALVTRETRSSSAACNNLMVLDLDKGKELYSKKLPGEPPVVDNVTVGDGMVASAWSGGSVGYTISSQKELWKADSSSDCVDEGLAGGEKLVSVVRCGEIDDPEYRVEQINPKTGKSSKTYELPSGTKKVMVASTDPLTLEVGANSSLSSHVFMPTKDWKGTEGRITLGNRYSRGCKDIDNCGSLWATKDRVFLPTKGANSGAGGNDVMAFDRKGQTQWKVSGGKDRKIMPIATEGQNVIAYKLPRYQQGGEVVSINPSGKPTTHLEIPATQEEAEQSISISEDMGLNQVVWRNNHLFIAQDLLSESSSDYGRTARLAVGFGPREG